jgi:hypothetical protein
LDTVSLNMTLSILLTAFHLSTFITGANTYR